MVWDWGPSKIYFFENIYFREKEENTTLTLEVV